MKASPFSLWFPVCSLCCLLSIQASAAESPALGQDYFAVLREGDVRKLRELLDGDVPPNARDAAGNTLLTD